VSCFANCLKQGFLDKVVGVGHVARPFRELARGPALEGPDMTGEETLNRFLGHPTLPDETG
jgi:hypothetical protein